MAETKLIGDTDPAADTSLGADFSVADRFTCDVGGTCTELRVKVSTSVDVKVAIYGDDNAGAPGTRLAKQDTAVSATSGVNTIVFESPVVLTATTKYWLCWNVDTATISAVESAGDGHKFQIDTHSGFTWPDPYTGWSTADQFTSLFAGWEDVVPPPTVGIPSWKLLLGVGR